MYRFGRFATVSRGKARCVLPALPSLRGLSKAIRGAEIAGVVVGVAIRLRSLRLKQTESVAPTRYFNNMIPSPAEYTPSTVTTNPACRTHGTDA